MGYKEHVMIVFGRNLYIIPYEEFIGTISDIVPWETRKRSDICPFHNKGVSPENETPDECHYTSRVKYIGSDWNEYDFCIMHDEILADIIENGKMKRFLSGVFEPERVLESYN